MNEEENEDEDEDKPSLANGEMKDHRLAEEQLKALVGKNRYTYTEMNIERPFLKANGYFLSRNKLQTLLVIIAQIRAGNYCKGLLALKFPLAM